MKARPHVSNILLGYASAVILTPAAVATTLSFAAFRAIPWTLSYLAIALAAELGGLPTALLSGLISLAGVLYLVIVPGSATGMQAGVQAVAFVVTGSFITHLVLQRSQAISSLKRSETHYRTVTETASDVVLTIDAESKILSINPSVLAIFGYEPQELIGQPLVQLMPERLRGAHMAGLARHLATGKRHIPWNGVQLPGLRKDGKEIALEVSFAAHKGDGPWRVTGFIRDISERQKSHAALIHNERLAAVGRLASSIAHEINNPLASVTNLLFLARHAEGRDEVNSHLDLADQELRRVTVIANQTLQFQRSSTVPTHADCDALIDGSLMLLQGKVQKAGVTIERRSRARHKALCVAGEIQQVLNSLVVNSIDATPEGGRILVRSRDAMDWKTLRTGVTLTVADTGTGIPEAIRSQIFDPFFSTREETGSGLGLWISSHLVKNNGGSMKMRSRAEGGTCGTVFTLFLPGIDGDGTAEVLTRVRTRQHLLRPEPSASD